MQIFPLRKTKVIVSDFHLGKGKHLKDGGVNLLEDFNSDRQFVDFLEYYRSGPYRKQDVELIVNGDFFNLLQIDYRDRFTDLVTESDSLHKMMSIIRGHPEFFRAMREFAQEPHHSIAFILGNHDPGLLWEGVQQALTRELGGNVRFFMEAYRFDGVHVEHGNQYHSDNRYDRKRYFLTKNLPEPIINLPWGSFFTIQCLNEIKKERPYFDKVYPFRLYQRWALIHDTLFAIKSMFMIVVWFFKFLLIPNPARHIGFWQVIRVLKEATVHPKLHKEAKRLLLSQKDCRIVVFGHTHQHTYIKFAPGKEYFNTGTWNEKISLEVGSLGRTLRLTYVTVDYDKEGIPHGSLKEWKGRSDVVEELVF